MKLCPPLLQACLRAALALPLLIAFPLHAAPAAPAALATLDVCHNELTGNWRYSGMVAVSGSDLKASSVMGVDYWVQNRTSSAGYADVLRVPSVDLAPLSTATSRMTRFSIEGAPLSVGTLRNNAHIAIADLLAPASAPLIFKAGAEFTEAVCGCPHPVGCTRTQGYWKSKPGVVWPAPYSRTLTLFFSTGLTWQQVLDTPPKGGNAYLILAHQYIAAVLNRGAGASAPSSLVTIINNATAWFSGGTNLDSCSGSACQTQKNWAALLDTYNNGQYPGAPSHCPE